MAASASTLGEVSRLRVALRAPIAAVTLLTILPVPARAQRAIGSREVAASAPFFPLVGAALGLAIGGLAHAVAARSGSALGAAVAVVLLAAVTGALHLDGLADSADALGARGGSKARRLEIMRDSSTGAYGTAAIAGWFVLSAAAIAAIPPDELAVTLAFVLAFARAAAANHAQRLPPARPGGLGAGFAVSPRALTTVMLMTALIALGLAVLPQDGGWLSSPGALPLLIVIATLAPVQLSLLGAAHRLLGGRTGDTLGATIALCEAAGLLAAALAIH